jgi:hypothetical protein
MIAVRHSIPLNYLKSIVFLREMEASRRSSNDDVKKMT